MIVLTAFRSQLPERLFRRLAGDEHIVPDADELVLE
jgi:hypothetical protein